MLPPYFGSPLDQGSGSFSRLLISTILVWITKRLYENAGP